MVDVLNIKTAAITKVIKNFIKEYWFIGRLTPHWSALQASSQRP